MISFLETMLVSSRPIFEPMLRFGRRTLVARIGLFFSCLFLLFIHAALLENAHAGALHRLRFDRLSIDQGLPSTGIQTLYQSRDGLVWLGTSNGLVRYDGRHMKLFVHAADTQASLDHNRIFSLYEDKQKQMWVGTRRGLNRVDQRTDRVTRFPLPITLTLEARTVYGIAPADAGRLWIASGGALLLFDPALEAMMTWKAKVNLSTLFSGEVRALIPDGNGGIWFAQGAHIAHLAQDGALLQHFDARQESGSASTNAASVVRSLALDGQGQLWVGMTAGLRLWKISEAPTTMLPLPLALPIPQLISLPPQLSLPKTVVTAILEDHEKAMWIALGSDQGLYRWRAEQKTLEKFVNLPAVSSSLSGNSLTSLMQDASGSLWIGTSDYGVNLVDLKGRGFTTYLQVPGDERSLSHRLVSALVPDGNDAVWIGTLGGGVNRLRLATGDVDRISRAEIDLDFIRSLLLDPQGRLWVGGDRLLLYDPQRHRSRPIVLPGLPPGAKLSALARDDLGNTWCGTSHGLYRITSDFVVTVFRADSKLANSLNDNAIDSLLFDRDRRLWIGTKSGLYLWHKEEAGFVRIGRMSASMPTPENLSVTSIRQDREGRIWIATMLGLFEVRPSGAVSNDTWDLVTWNLTPPIATDIIESMQDASNGEIWLSSERGLMQVIPEKKQGRNFPSLGRFDGAFSFAAAARSDDGSLFFGGVGLVVFHPENIWGNAMPPKVVLSDILLFNRSLVKNPEETSAVKTAAASSVELADEDVSNANYDLASVGINTPLSEASAMKLGYRQSMVSFEISALHFYNRSQIRYAWKLEGYDRDWIMGQFDKSVATYTNLDAGSYRLLAKAANPDGVWGESTDLLTLEVLPPYWRTWWWYTVWSLALGLAFYGYFQKRSRAAMANQRYLEQEVKVQTQEAIEQKRVAETQRELAERARYDIERLSEIGLQITSSLEVQEILETLYTNVKALVRASTFGIGMVDWEKRVICFDHSIQNDQKILPYVRSLDALEQPSSRCVLSGQELIIDEILHDSRKVDSFLLKSKAESEIKMENGSSTEISKSAIYVPMVLAGRVMGVIAALSGKTHAFTQNDLHILRTLASYTAVAFDNAEAYRCLKLTQSKLVEQEKLAALGSLVAGVAHELNTPIGNSLLMASTMQGMSQDLLARVKTNQLRRSDFEKFCEGNSASADLMVRNLNNAANLVNSFKQIAVDQTSDQRRSFDLASFCDEVALTLSNRVKREGHSLHLQIEPNLILDSYPGSLGQVLSNLIINAMVHGFQSGTHGLIQVIGRAEGTEEVLLEVSDNGLGITKENIARIFEPFFTTRLGKGGSGLGLHICYNIVNSVLGGSIDVVSTTGLGSSFTLRLPRFAPVDRQTQKVT